MPENTAPARKRAAAASAARDPNVDPTPLPPLPPLQPVTKPDLSLVRRAPMVHIARGLEVGAAVVPGRTRGDYLRPKAPLSAVRDHLRATVSHAMRVLDEIEMQPGCDGADGVTGLPHLTLALTRLHMAVAVAVQSGLVAEDPAGA